MSRRCQLTGRGPQVGNTVSHAHNVSKRRWNINLQKVRVLIDGRVLRMRVSTKAIKSGLVVKPTFVIKAPKVKVLKPQLTGAAAVGVEEEQFEDFFSSMSVVSRIFKPKPKNADGSSIEEDSIEEQFMRDTMVDDTPEKPIPELPKLPDTRKKPEAPAAPEQTDANSES